MSHKQVLTSFSVWFLWEPASKCVGNLQGFQVQESSTLATAKGITQARPGIVLLSLVTVQ